MPYVPRDAGQKVIGRKGNMHTRQTYTNTAKSEINDKLSEDIERIKC